MSAFGFRVEGLYDTEGRVLPGRVLRKESPRLVFYDLGEDGCEGEALLSVDLSKDTVSDLLSGLSAVQEAYCGVDRRSSVSGGLRARLRAVLGVFRDSPRLAGFVLVLLGLLAGVVFF